MPGLGSPSRQTSPRIRSSVGACVSRVRRSSRFWVPWRVGAAVDRLPAQEAAAEAEAGQGAEAEAEAETEAEAELPRCLNFAGATSTHSSAAGSSRRRPTI